MMFPFMLVCAIIKEQLMHLALKEYLAHITSSRKAFLTDIQLVVTTGGPSDCSFQILAGLSSNIECILNNIPLKLNFIRLL